MPNLVEKYKLDTEEGRRKFYEILAAHKEELENFSVDLPDYEQYEKECAMRLEVAAMAGKRKEEFDKAKGKYKAEEGSARTYFYFLQLEGEDAEKNNEQLIKKVNEDKKGYANDIANKLLSYDPTKIINDMKDKTDAEIAKMYYEDPMPFNLGWVVKDIKVNYFQYYDEETKKKINEKFFDYQELGRIQKIAQNCEEEMYPYIPSVNPDKLYKFGPKPVDFGLGASDNMEIFNLLTNNGMAKAQERQEVEEAYKNTVDEKIDDMLAALKTSRDTSKWNSSEFKAMDTALKAFKQGWKGDNERDRLKENLRNAAENYLTYKAKRTMKDNAQGKVAAADGILEMLNEIDSHKEFSATSIKAFEKASETNKKVYETRAKAVHERIKTNLNDLKKEEGVAENTKKTAKSSQTEKAKIKEK